MYHLSVDPYLGDPFFDVFFPVNTLVFGFAGAGEFSSVAVVLSLRGRPEVRLAIVEGVMIYMVREQAIADLDDFPVHEYEFVLSCLWIHVLPCDVKRAVSRSPCFPFVFAEALVIFGVHNGIPGLHQTDASEGVAVAHPAI